MHLTGLKNKKTGFLFACFMQAINVFSYQCYINLKANTLSLKSE